MRTNRKRRGMRFMRFVFSASTIHRHRSWHMKRLKRGMKNHMSAYNIGDSRWWRVRGQG